MTPDLPLLRGSERKARPRGVLGEDGHHNWTGDQASYSARHQRLRAIRGSASQFQCVDCQSPAVDWSQVTGSTGLDVYKDYAPRCRSCHMSYDNQGDRLRGYRHLGSAHGLSKLTEEDIPVIRRRLKNGETQRVIALDYGVHQVTISRIKTGKDWSHITIGGDLNGIV
ncbi:hypothetical protein [Gordonia phage GTE5]|uniref:Uncharacterized protein n=1 Tax=Gordonia phage GTE5 TaxID=319522 RepID=G8EJS2_9CAUD|nr:hypothetical protein GoPhGTE5p55 [Gordonia phage GTE5]AET09804.1 hypothetical protein [Gordonia phage GTE5]